MKKTRVVIGNNILSIDSELLNLSQLELDFGGSLLVQITKEDSVWKVTNAVNGHGQNMLGQLKDEKVIFVDEPSVTLSEVEEVCNRLSKINPEMSSAYSDLFNTLKR